MSTIQASSATTLPQLSMPHQSSQLQITQPFQSSLKQSSVCVIKHALHHPDFRSHLCCLHGIMWYPSSLPKDLPLHVLVSILSHELVNPCTRMMAKTTLIMDHPFATSFPPFSLLCMSRL